jgi:hypothetical protein
MQSKAAGRDREELKYSVSGGHAGKLHGLERNRFHAMIKNISCIDG